MYNPKYYKLRKAFSLIELLIVIFIISLVYYLGFEGIELRKPKPKPLTPINLKSNIINSESFNGYATLMCLDKCKTCYIRKELNSDFQKYENTINLKNITTYTLDKEDRLKEIEYGRFKDRKICLIIDFYQNGSSTQMILENDEKVYFLPAFFGEAEEFDSLEKAKEYWLRDSKLISDSGKFY